MIEYGPGDETKMNLAQKKSEEKNCSRNKYHDVSFFFEFSNDLFFIADTNYIIQKANLNWQKLLGYSPDELVGKYLPEILKDEKIKEHCKKVYDGKIKDQNIDFTYHEKTKNGEVKWFAWNLKSDNGYIYGRASDISAKKEIEEQFYETKEKSRNREATLRAVLDSITEFTVLVDSNGIINAANETAALMLNSTVDNLIGISITELLDKPILEKNKNYIREAAATQKPVRFEEAENGIIYNVTIYPVLEGKGIVNRFVILLVDITARRDAFEAVRERDAMLSALINATTESAFLIDSFGKILIANDTVAKRFGTSVSDFIGNYLYDLLTTENAILRKKYIDNVIETGQPIRFEDKRGNLIIDNSIYPVFDKDGKVVQMALFGSDITSRKHADEEIKLINKKLLDLNSTKDKFFSIIAHDLRSPFQGLLGYSQILIEEYDDLSETEKKQYIHNISDISKSSYKLLENLLQWSRMQTGNFEFNPEVVNVSEELMPTIDLLKKTALNKSISIISSIKLKSYVMADKNMLNTIVRNLVSNSIKFTKPNGTISISSSELNDYVVISIKDNGVGMESEKLKNLFKPVKNISTLGTEKEKGTGLGLLLCKEMVDKHNGEIWVESQPDIGSTFYFTLPIRI